MPMMTDPGAFAHTSEGVGRAEELAAHTMESLVTTVEIARLDTVITSMFMLAEVLAGLEFYAGLSAKDAIKQVSHLTAERVDLLRDEEAAADDGNRCRPAAPSPEVLSALH